jgi:hypothetical protein
MSTASKDQGRVRAASASVEFGLSLTARMPLAEPIRGLSYIGGCLMEQAPMYEYGRLS